MSTGILDGTGPGATFGSVLGIAVDANGNVFVSDYGNGLIRKVTPAGVVTTVAGNGTTTGGDGIGVQASIVTPKAMVIDAAQNVLVLDNRGLRKITPSGV